MKATEVLNRYANGERDFRRANLRGQNFKGQDLSGADFTEADIRGANFNNAVLKGANFTGAKAGVQKRWVIGQLLLLFLISALAGVLQGYFGYYIAYYFPRWWDSTYDRTYVVTDVTTTISFFITISAASIAIARQGFTSKVAATICFAVAVAVAAAAAVAVTVAAAVAVAIVVAIAVAIAVAIVVAIAAAVAVAIAVAEAVAGAGAIAVAVAVAGAGAGAVAVAVSVASLLLSIYAARRALKGDEKFELTRSFGIDFAAIGGTAFCGADLTQANFTNATLKSTNFNHTKQQPTNLTHVCWQDAKKLDRARVGDSILANSTVLKLLVTRDGHNQTYIDANLRGANLNGVNLNAANLKWTDLSDATLHRAELKDANLREVLAIGTDFTAAYLTGACLEAWNIDSNTKLEDVDCQYVYLLRNQQERRPSSGDFAPGEFTKLFQEALNTVDLIFRNGVDWKAFVAAFKTVQVDNDGTELTIQSIENKGDGVVVVRVSVQEEADKAKIHSEFNQNYDLALKALEAKYHAELKAKDEQITIYREKSADMTEILRLLANRPVTVEVNASAESKAMSDSTDKSQSVNIGGNVTGSTINLGAISGSVSNVVNQLPSTPDSAQPGIKELLLELQAAIESDADLPEKGKASALEQVKVLAEVAQDPEQPEKKGLGSQAVTFFKNAASFLPDTAKLAEACTKLLPLITKALGLPF
ncbi:MAG: pentapeptide repeat-containing protein [Stenomitos rutilans HA7619-LM2]|jgi:uncharacterized protein YjbI with pentapeptide repeats|nr:pentapeptide repeat-containing protein [Stenomitos rutilans HA7619-LM2]